MAATTYAVQGVRFEELMQGVDDAVRKIMEDALLFYTDETDTSASGEKAKSDKLRNAYNELVKFLILNKLNDLNNAQKVFLCTGAVGDVVQYEKGGQTQELVLIPKEVYDVLERSVQGSAEDSPFPVFTVLDKFTAIAKGELLALDMSEDRKKALRNSPQDQKRIRDEWRRKADQLKREIQAAANQLEIFLPKLMATFGESAIKNVKVSLEVIRKVAAGWGRGEAATPQEKAVVQALEGKIGDAGLGLVKWAQEVQTQLGPIMENAQNVSDRYQNLQRALAEMEKVGQGGGPVERTGPLFDAETISKIRTDVDTTNSVSVRAADASPLRVAYSASRVLVNKQFLEGEDPLQRLCTRQAVTAALEKITKLHVNVFPKDSDGNYIIPPFCIEPLRNFVDFFDDRFIMAFVSGEQPRKGPFVSFSPVELQVLRACGLYLTKDPIYDYRGEVKRGTFMGDYVGRIEKQTKVKWTGQEKKFSLATTQSMQDTASREDALNDYMDFLFAVANSTAPPPKLSKRKIAVLFKYVLFEDMNKTVAGILKMVAQQEPAEAKEVLNYFTKEKPEVAKQMIASAMKSDPQASKLFSDNPDFAFNRIFGQKR